MIAHAIDLHHFAISCPCMSQPIVLMMMHCACRCVRSLPEPGGRSHAWYSLMSWTVWLLQEELALTQVSWHCRVWIVLIYPECANA